MLAMLSTLSIVFPGASSSTVSPQWRHAICGLTLIILSVGMILLEAFIRTPMHVRFWYGCVCLIPAIIAFMRGFLRIKTLAITSFVPNCIGIPVVLVAKTLINATIAAVRHTLPYQKRSNRSHTRWESSHYWLSHGSSWSWIVRLINKDFKQGSLDAIWFTCEMVSSAKNHFI